MASPGTDSNAAVVCPQGVFRELPELLESSGQPDAPALLSVPSMAAAAELICDVKQEGEQQYLRLNAAKVLCCNPVRPCAGDAAQCCHRMGAGLIV